MPIICIGPVCIPITAVVPLLLFIFKPIYDRLPKEYQEKIDYGIKQCQLALNRCLRKVGWTKRKKEKVDELTADDVPTEGANGHQASRVRELRDEDEWDGLLDQSKSENLIFIAYFTSPLSARSLFPIRCPPIPSSQCTFSFLSIPSNVLVFTVLHAMCIIVALQVV